jgi:biotin operon repressor
MLKCNITINQKNEATISVEQQFSESEETLRVFNRMKTEALILYNRMIRDIGTEEYVKNIVSLEKKKDVEIQWKIGKKIVEYIVEWNKAGVDITNLCFAIAKSLGGSTEAWELTVKFYTVNTNGEYLNYDWWFCTILAEIFHPDLRKILIMAYDTGVITKHESAKLWKNIIVSGDPKKALAPSQRQVYDALKEKPQTETEIAEVTGLSRHSVRGRITELRNNHLYQILQQDGVYTLVDDEKERAEQIAQAKQKIKETVKELGYEGVFGV